jgi:hypothetical protein
MTNENAPPPEYEPPTDYENLLARQALTLDEMFEKYRAQMFTDRYFSETGFNILMRAQGHCRATVEILRKYRKDAEKG